MLVTRIGRRLSWRHARRSYASISTTTLNPNSVGPFQVFDRGAKVLQKDRAAVKNDGENSRTVDYVREEVAERMIERLLVSECASLSRIK